MFATKKDAEAWVRDFGKGLNLSVNRYIKYWEIYDAAGFALSDEKIAAIESMDKPEVRE
jgi:hypothetical protein